MNASSAMFHPLCIAGEPAVKPDSTTDLGHSGNLRRQGTTEPDSKCFGGPRSFWNFHPDVSAAFPHIIPDPSALRDSAPMLTLWADSSVGFPPPAAAPFQRRFIWLSEGFRMPHGPFWMSCMVGPLRSLRRRGRTGSSPTAFHARLTARSRLAGTPLPFPTLPIPDPWGWPAAGAAGPYFRDSSASSAATRFAAECAMPSVTVATLLLRLISTKLFSAPLLADPCPVRIRLSRPPPGSPPATTGSHSRQPSAPGAASAAATPRPAPPAGW